LALSLVLVVFAPRRWAVLAILGGVLYLTQGQSIDVLGINIFPSRFMEVAGLSRVIVRRELSLTGFNRIDRAMLILYSYATIVYLVRSTEPQLFQIGLAVDAIFCYFTFRGLIWTIEDFRWILRGFLILLMPYTVFVSIEMLTGHNAFAFMGGIIENSLIRSGRPRCWGSFRHPILLGTFGASFLPLYIGLSFANKNRIHGFIGAGFCIVIVVASNSGGPLTSFITAVVGWLLWKVRYKMHLVRRSIIGMIVLLAIVMKAPIWYLTFRISSIVGGGGWHRGYLIDISMQNLEKWWIAGMPIKETHDWFPYTSDALVGADITNQYIAFGLNAGLGAIGLFILLLVRAFRSLGEALIAVRAASIKYDESEFILWGLGVMLAVHTVSLIGVSFFDKMCTVFFMQLAVISSLTEALTESDHRVALNISSKKERANGSTTSCC